MGKIFKITRTKFLVIQMKESSSRPKLVGSEKDTVLGKPEYLDIPKCHAHILERPRLTEQTVDSM